MPQRDLVSLSIEALNQTAHIRHLQKLVEVCVEQMDNPTNDAIERVDLILDSYRASMDNHIQELEVVLNRLKLIICADWDK